MDNMDPCQ